MKDLKFKAWDRFHKKYLPDGEIMVNSKGTTIWDTKEYPNKEETNTIEIHIYTGIKDKFGKEIYEGDIIKTPRGQGLVFDRAGCWFIELQKELGYFPNYDLEITGNQFENPELTY